MQTLQKCMEEMKAVYNLNQEKLGFNFTVLRDRKEHSTETINKLRAQERKKGEDMRHTKIKFEKMSLEAETTNKKLTREYKKFTRYFLILQKRFESFEKADKERYNEIRRMN